MSEKIAEVGIKKEKGDNNQTMTSKMKKTQKIKNGCAVVFAIICLAVSCSYSSTKTEAIKWMFSAECDALCYQAFNSATRYIDSLPSSEKKRAIILDIDETLLSQAPFMEHIDTNEIEFSNDKLNLWRKKNPLKAIPGAVDFCNFVKNKGIEIFYISNLPESQLNIVIKDMQLNGFPFIDKQHMLFRTDTVLKKERVDYVKSIADVVLFGGDNLSDLGVDLHKKDPEIRRQWVKDNKEFFGSRYIVLPNAMYRDRQKATDK